MDEDVTDISLFLKQSTQIDQKEEESEEEETSDQIEFDNEQYFNYCVARFFIKKICAIIFP